MMDSHQITCSLPAGRAHWTKPRVSRIAGGRAQAGANPVISEGTFGQGS